MNANYIWDINFLLLKDRFARTNEKRVLDYYNNYIKGNLFYSLPELFSTDIVNVPKGLSGVREYRFFSMFSMVLYNAVGLLFIDSCNDIIVSTDFRGKGVFSFYPNPFKLYNKSLNSNKNKWGVNNDYRKQYKSFFTFTFAVKVNVKVNVKVEKSLVLLLLIQASARRAGGFPNGHDAVFVK